MRTASATGESAKAPPAGVPRLAASIPEMPSFGEDRHFFGVPPRMRLAYGNAFALTESSLRVFALQPLSS